MRQLLTYCPPRIVSLKWTRQSSRSSTLPSAAEPGAAGTDDEDVVVERVEFWQGVRGQWSGVRNASSNASARTDIGWTRGRGRPRFSAMIRSYRDLLVWQRAMALAESCYRL